MHASRATHSLARKGGFDGAANGCVTRDQSAPKTGIARGNPD